MEEAFLIDFNDIQTCEKANILLGSHSCPKWLERKDLVNELKASHAERIALIIPPLIPRWFRIFSGLLEEIHSGWQGHPLEIVANDWGVFYHSISFDKRSPGKIIPAIGRFLVRSDTDPDIASFLDSGHHPERLARDNDGTVARLVYSPPAKSLVEHWRTPSLFSASSACALQSLISSKLLMETDIPLHGLHDKGDGLPDSIYISAYLGRVILAIIPCKDCSSCPKEEKRIGASRSGIPIYRKLNLIYYCNSGIQFKIPAYIERIIHDS